MRVTTKNVLERLAVYTVLSAISIGMWILAGVMVYRLYHIVWK